MLLTVVYLRFYNQQRKLVGRYISDGISIFFIDASQKEKIQQHFSNFYNFFSRFLDYELVTPNHRKLSTQPDISPLARKSLGGSRCKTSPQVHRKPLLVPFLHNNRTTRLFILRGLFKSSSSPTLLLKKINWNAII